MLEWEERYAEFQAETDHGSYHIDSPDSIGQRQVTFYQGTQEVFVAIKTSERDAKNSAEDHFAWLSSVKAKTVDT